MVRKRGSVVGGIGEGMRMPTCYWFLKKIRIFLKSLLEESPTSMITRSSPLGFRPQGVLRLGAYPTVC